MKTFLFLTLTAVGMTSLAAPHPFFTSAAAHRLDVLEQDQSDDIEAQVRALLAAARDGTAQAAAAQAELDALAQSSWSALYDLYVGTKDDHLRSNLRHLLGIAFAAESPIVVRGRLVRAEHNQGGVVDHHDLYLHFDGPVVVWKGADALKDHLTTPSMLRLARGTSQDTWLCELMEKEALRLPGDGLFALRPRSLRYAYGADGPETAFAYFEFHRLPAAAARAYEDITGICAKGKER